MTLPRMQFKRRPTSSLLILISLVVVITLNTPTLATSPEEDEFDFPPEKIIVPNNNGWGQDLTLNQNLLSYLPSKITRHLQRSLGATSDTCATSTSFVCPTTSCPEGYTTVSDCNECNGYLFADYSRGVCYDRELFHEDFLWADLLAALLWFLTAGIATSCGVGGGGIYVPMGILLLRFPPKPSSGLSQASIFGAALGGILINSRKCHPDTHIRDTRGTPLEDQNGTTTGKIISYEKGMTNKEIEEDREKYLRGGDGTRKFYSRPVIDYDMALFLAPLQMAGAVLGVIIQRLFPNWLFLSAAAVILGFTSYKTFKKFRTSYRKEKGLRAEKLAREKNLEASQVKTKRASDFSVSEEGEDVESGTDGSVSADEVVDASERTGGPGSTKERNDTDVANKEEPDDDPKELEMRRHFLEMDSRQYPKEKIASLVLLWVGLTAIAFLKGGKGVDSVIGITCEDPAYYVLVASQFIWTLGFGAVFAYKGIKQTRARLEVHYPFNETDVLWDFKKVRYYSFFTFVAGIVAGLIGIGGGMVLGPLMLVMGIHPSVSSATNATMIVLTSSSVAVMFVMSGLVPWEYAVFFFFVCFCGAILGMLRINSYIKKTGKSSVLIGVLAAIIGFATLGCVFILLLNLSKVDWCLAGFNKFCSVGKGDELECTAGRLLSEAEAIFPY